MLASVSLDCTGLAQITVRYSFSNQQGVAAPGFDPSFLDSLSESMSSLDSFSSAAASAAGSNPRQNLLTPGSWSDPANPASDSLSEAEDNPVDSGPTLTPDGSSRTQNGNGSDATQNNAPARVQSQQAQNSAGAGHDGPSRTGSMPAAWSRDARASNKTKAPQSREGAAAASTSDSRGTMSDADQTSGLSSASGPQAASSNEGLNPVSTAPTDVGGVEANGKTHPAKTAGKTPGLAFAVRISGPGQQAAGGKNPDPPPAANQTLDNFGTALADGGTGTTSDPIPVRADQVTGSLALPAGLSALTGAPNSNESGTSDSPDEKAAPAKGGIITETTGELPDAIPAVRTVQLQISGAESQRVDLRLVESAGALTVSVRTADSSLAKAMQQGLPEISTRLDDQQIQAEWWKPGADAEATTSNHEGSSPTDQQTGNQADQNGKQQGEENRRQSAQPDWLEELFDSRKSQSQGAQFTWQL